MPKLNQIIAIEKTTKNRINDDITKLYHQAQKADPFKGLSRTYQPKTEDGDVFPPEATKVQVKATEMLASTQRLISELCDLVRTKDEANTLARADVKVDGKTVLPNVPVAHLLFLENQLKDLLTMVKKIPTLDQAEEWVYDDKNGVYVTPPTKTLKTKKVPRNHVKAEATKEHPAQVEVYYEDIVVGTWTQAKSSGALPSKTLGLICQRIETLSAAVKAAREEANGISAPEFKEGDALMRALFEGVL